MTVIFSATLIQPHKLSNMWVSRATCRQFLSSCMALMTSFVYGCKVGYTESATSMFLSSNPPFQVTPNEISWMASISYIGTLVSVILCYKLTNKVSWSTFILASAATFTLSWFLILVTSSMKVIIVCFLFYGIAASILNITAHIYFTEIASSENREIFIIFYSLATALGIQVEYSLSTFENYRLLAAFPLVVGILTLILSLCMVESPYYLVSKGRNEKAKENMCWLQDRKYDNNLSNDFHAIENYVQEQRGIDVSSDFKAIFIPGNLKLVGIIMLIGLPGTINYSTIIYAYGPLTVKDLEPYVNGRIFVNLYSMSRIVCNLFSIITVKKFRRRFLILYGLTTLGLIQLLCSFCFYLQNKEFNSESPFIAYAIAVLLLSFLMLDGTTYGPGLCIFKHEVFPHRLKEFYTSLLAFKADCVAFIVVKSYLWATSLIGIDYLLLFYCFFNLVGALCAYFFIPDTKRKSLNQIRIDYGTIL